MNQKTNLTKTITLFVIILIILNPIVYAETTQEDNQNLDPDEYESNYDLSSFYIPESLIKIDKGLTSKSYSPLSYNPPVSAKNMMPQNAPSNILGSFFSEGLFDTHLFSGSAGYSYSLNVPPGMNGFEPIITLSYNQHQSNVAGELGRGWGLNKNFIYRDTEYSRADTSDDIFYLNLNGVNLKLVYVASEDRYHTETETYMYIKKDENSWLVKTKDGTQYKLGYTADSKLDSSLESFTSIWHLNEVEDTYGNKITYKYTKNPSSDLAIYLDEITYGLNKIKFNYDFDSENGFYGYAYGTKLIQTGLLNNIEIKNNNNLVRKYKLGYETIDNKKFLKKIRILGQDGSSELPPVEFSYFQNTKGWQQDDSWKVPSDVNFGSDKDEGFRMVDVNGDGYTDIIKAKGDEHKVWYNNKNGFNQYQTLNNFIPGGFVDSKNRDRGVRFLDYNGDTRIDLLQSLSGNENVQNLIVNNGVSFHEESHGLPSSLSFAEIKDQSCTPLNCEEGWTDDGVTCGDYYCIRTCSFTYYICNKNWVQVFGNSGPGYDKDYYAENHDDTEKYYPPSNTKCYKFFVDTPNDVSMRVDEDECFNGYDDDGDSVFIAGLRSSSCGNDQWLDTVPPLSTNPYHGWYGDLEDPFQSADFKCSYITTHAFSSDDFDYEDRNYFKNNDKYIYCAPSYESCYYSNFDSSCGYGCYNIGTKAFVQSGYYMDVGNSIETIAYDEECDDSEVSSNDAEYIRLVVYESDSDEQKESYEEYCNLPPSYKDLGARLADVNSDGKTDIIKVTLSEKKTWLRTNDGWQEDNDWMVSNNIIDEDNNDEGVRFFDVNGDGLIDTVTGEGSSRTTLLNTGKGWQSDSVWMIPSDASFVENNEDKGVTLVDVNGDGLSDILRNDGSTIKTWINNGRGWVEDSSWSLPSQAKLTGNYVNIVDVNGDGLPDVVRADGTRTTWINIYQKQYLLKEIKTRLGGKIQINYEKISKFDNTGSDSISDLSFGGWVVSSVTYDNGLSNEHKVTSTFTYEYEGGLFDPDDREFRGFNYVLETRPDGSKVKHWFHQDDARKGIEHKTKIENNDGNVYKTIENIWKTTTKNEYYIIHLTEEIHYLFDGVEV